MQNWSTTPDYVDLVSINSSLDWIFHLSENIFGYKDLRVDVYCSAARMNTYVSMKYSDKLTPDKCDGVSVSSRNLSPILFG